MRFMADWWFPSGERHIPAWMIKPKNQLPINGRQSYQGDKQLHSMALCKRKGLALDVGGHVGLWSYNLSHAFDKVIAFEPVEEHQHCFKRNMIGRDNVELMPVALGKEPGKVSIFSEECNSGYSYVDGPGEIPMITLDSLNLKDVDFLKIDCEGYEENVIRGGIETITRSKPVIIVEQKRDMAEKLGLPTLGAVDLLKSLGYKVVEEMHGDYITVAEGSLTVSTRLPRSAKSTWGRSSQRRSRSRSR